MELLDRGAGIDLPEQALPEEDLGGSKQCHTTDDAGGGASCETASGGSGSVLLAQPTQSMNGSRLHIRQRPQSSLMISTAYPRVRSRSASHPASCRP